MEVPPADSAGRNELEPFRVRLKQRALDPSMLLSNPPVAALFCLLRYMGLIAKLPYWLLVVIVLSGGCMAILASALWGEDRRSWNLPTYVGVNMGVITVVAYATGWGPILSIGFVFGSGTTFELFGPKATRWLLGSTVVWMALGQTAIGLGIAPTLIRQPLVHGLAGLTLLGSLLTISLLGRTTSERERVAAELEGSEGWFRALVSQSSDLIMVVDPTGRLRYASPVFEHLLGVAPDEYLGTSMEDFLHPEDLHLVSEQYRRLLENPTQVLRTHLRYRDVRGGWRHFEATVTNRVGDPYVRGIVGNMHDITDLVEANERFRSAFEDAPIGMALGSMDGVILRANRAFGAIVGIAPETLVGQRSEVLFPHQDGVVGPDLSEFSGGRSEGYETERHFVRPDGTEAWALVHISCVHDSDGTPRYFIGQVQDVTEQHEMRERLAHAAIHDPLTGLPNRALFIDRLELALARAARSKHRVAVAFLDLDHFKLVNDALGHSTGDELLKAVAVRLKEALRDEDTVARFGGDEFTILWEDLKSKQEALTVATRILDELQRPFEVEGTPVFASASIGVVLRGSASGSPSAMLRDADAAMYIAKAAGRGRVEIFDGRSHAVALKSLNVINELHAALANDELRLHYQPIIDLGSGGTSAVEALVHWEHPVRGLLGPDEFIPVAEDCGLIVPIGAWVLRSACEQTARWNEARREHGILPLEVHVNIAPRQLTNLDFVDGVAAVLADTGIEPSALCLEITESTLMTDQRLSAQALHSLRALGVRSSIDDFGTGYSSLTYLKQFPIDSLKVDRSFVDGLGEDPDDSIIVSAVIALAHSLGLLAIAEGVETEIALEELRRLRCDRAQGYLFSRPLPPGEIEALTGLSGEHDYEKLARIV